MEKISKKDYNVLRKNLLYLYRAKLKFELTYSFIKTFHKNDYFYEIENNFNLFLNNLLYEIKSNEFILNYIKKHKLIVDSDIYDLIWEILDLLLSFESENLILIKNIINVINGYNYDYKYISNNNYDEINNYKLTIDSFFKKF